MWTRGPWESCETLSTGPAINVDCVKNYHEKDPEDQSEKRNEGSFLIYFLSYFLS